ncbi:pentapeptide repeat-containing protein [Alphaproteobacteria bacterium LSUCC0684]
MNLKKRLNSPLFYLALAAGIIAAISWYLIACPPDWLWRDGAGNVEILRGAILALGLIGGFYGLILATQRQNTFQKQTENAHEQLFNERLGRGAQLLAQKKHITLRLSGLRLLEDLAETSSQDQRKLIARMLHDFICQKCQLRYEKEGEGESEDKGNLLPRRPRSKHMDTELAIKAVIKVAEKAEMSGEDIPFNRLDFRGLYFENITTSLGLDFRSAKMESCRFKNVNIPNTDFSYANLENATFEIANLTGSKFILTNLNGTQFGTLFIDVAPDEPGEMVNLIKDNGRIIQAKYQSADLSGCKFEKKFVSASVYLDDATFHQDKPPLNLDSPAFMDCNAYRWEKGSDGSIHPRYIKSDQRYSRQWINIPTPPPEKEDA